MADEKLNTGPAENISPEAAEPITTPEQAATSEPPAGTDRACHNPDRPRPIAEQMKNAAKLAEADHGLEAPAPQRRQPDRGDR